MRPFRINVNKGIHTLLDMSTVAVVAKSNNLDSLMNMIPHFGEVLPNGTIVVGYMQELTHGRVLIRTKNLAAANKHGWVHVPEHRSESDGLIVVERK